jgi:hypothetical protein
MLQWRYFSSEWGSPVKNMSIASLNAEKTALQAEHDSIRAAIVDAEKALAQPGLLEIDKLILANQAQSLHNRSISLDQRIMTLDARLAQLQWSSYDSRTACIFVFFTHHAAWNLYFRYCKWRHARFPFTRRQLDLRETVFGFEFSCRDYEMRSHHRLLRQLLQRVWARARDAWPPK